MYKCRASLTIQANDKHGLKIASSSALDVGGHPCLVIVTSPLNSLNDL